MDTKPQRSSASCAKPIEAEAYAVVAASGAIMVRTVSPHRRGALVNWLSAVPRIAIFESASDADIEEVWREHCGRSTVQRVRVTVMNGVHHERQA
jgi:hypothetical protein